MLGGPSSSWLLRYKKGEREREREGGEKEQRELHTHAHERQVVAFEVALAVAQCDLRAPAEINGRRSCWG